MGLSVFGLAPNSKVLLHFADFFDLNGSLIKRFYNPFKISQSEDGYRFAFIKPDFEELGFEVSDMNLFWFTGSPFCADLLVIPDVN